MLDLNNSLLLIIDVQEKLVKACKDSDTIGKKVIALGATAKVLNIPTIVTEQYPQGLGVTIEDVKSVLAEGTIYKEKADFSAIGTINEELRSLGRKQIILCGIETHICVYQTAMRLLDLGYEVYLVKDACSSRKEFEHQTGLDLMKGAGAKLTCVETILFELLQTSKHPNFKEIQSLIK